MGALAPLYLAGLVALGLPLLLHLVRRTPTGRQNFSSLMFLLPSPPRLTRRSRLDQILLLLLRLAAVALLAFAFARPFLRESATLALSDLPARKVAILVDTSASMRRADLWQQAQQAIEREVADLNAHDEVGLFAFGEQLRTVVGFDAVSADAKQSRGEIVRQAANKLRPTWEATHLGAVMASLAAELDAAKDVEQSAARPQIVVISDFQASARLDALQGFEWPQEVQVVPRVLAVKRPTNATVQLLASEEGEPASELRVRVVNAGSSRDDQFFVSWAATEAKPEAKASTAGELAVYVPPGQSRVVKLPRPEDRLTSDRIVLRGDDHDFDNTFYVVPPRKQQVRVLYFGADAADDESGSRHYLQLAATGEVLREVTVEELDLAGAALAKEPRARLVVVTSKLPGELAKSLQEFADGGGTVVVAPVDRAAAEAITQLLDDVTLSGRERSTDDFSLLGEISFAHPLFAPFASPRYSDFTKIHFWKRAPLALGDSPKTTVIARFDDGEPAIVERVSKQGQIVALASGWDPESSQLALSSKFVPLVGALLDHACGTAESLGAVAVGQAVTLPENAAQRMLEVQPPSGTPIKIPPAERSFANTAEPGVYRILAGDDEQRFAVNLAAAESNTAPLELEQLDRLGVKSGPALTRVERLDRIRQQRDTELESRQKIWRWLLVAALGVLIFETFWAGRVARQIASSEAAA